MTYRHRNNIFVLTIIFVLLAIQGASQKTAIYFKTNDYSLDINATRLIDSLSKITGIEKIYLQGHCDSIGNHNFNDALSLKRVNTVKTHLISNGLDEQLIIIKALGKRASINKNSDQTQRALNRRVDIELLITPKKEIIKADTLKTHSTFTTDEVEVIINGIVVNENNKPLIADILLSDRDGKPVDSTTSGKDGKYKFKTRLKKKQDYSLTFYNDSSFISSKIINVSTPRKPYKNLKTILPKLKDGNKYILENFNFEGDTSQLISASLPSLEALYRLMKKNRSLVIRIEGHVNFPNYWGGLKKPAEAKHYAPPGMNRAEFNQWLSEERAKMVFNYLIEKGIKPKRMSTIGYGATKMLFPDTHLESEMEQNRRVEINVISFKGRPVD